MTVRSIIIEHEIPSPITYAVEVTIELDSGERRWCFFCTPDSPDRFGDFLPNSTIRTQRSELNDPNSTIRIQRSEFTLPQLT